MSKLQYTKGPWVKDGIALVGKDGKQVIVSEGPGFGTKAAWDDAEGNSKIVMSSPEMYETLKTLVDVIENGSPMELMENIANISKEAKHIIEKIEG